MDESLAVTWTTTVHTLPLASLPPSLRLTVFPPSKAVTVPPQLLEPKAGVARVMPEGK